VDNESDPDKLAEEAVVAMVKVPLTAAVVPDALLLKLKDAGPPLPPATASISASVSSMMISMCSSPLWM